jgi:beta-glucosidase
MQLAQTANTLVVALGEHGYQSGEGRSRTSIRLPGLQEDFLRALVNQHPRVVLVLFAGRPLIIPDDIRTRLGALLLAWQPGTHAGDAVASVLMGDFNPSGRLPMTFPRHEGQIPLAYNDYTGGRPGPSQEVFWSHFNDLPNTPLYPFGYGLSYSAFQYGEPMLTKAKDGSLSLSVAVTNVSKRAGTETVQLYYRRMWSKHGVPPAKELAGFQQIQLAPGATKTVQFAITAADLRSFDAHGVAHAAQGEVRFWLAPNSGVEMKHLTFVFE